MADPKWQTKEAATKFLGHLATAAPEAISVSLSRRLRVACRQLPAPAALPPPQHCP